jgi:hypothetical protein
VTDLRSVAFAQHTKSIPVTTKQRRLSRLSDVQRRGFFCLGSSRQDSLWHLTDNWRQIVWHLLALPRSRTILPRNQNAALHRGTSGQENPACSSFSFSIISHSTNDMTAEWGVRSTFLSLMLR